MQALVSNEPCNGRCVIDAFKNNGRWRLSALGNSRRGICAFCWSRLSGNWFVCVVENVSDGGLFRAQLSAKLQKSPGDFRWKTLEMNECYARRGKCKCEVFLFRSARRKRLKLWRAFENFRLAIYRFVIIDFVEKKLFTIIELKIILFLYTKMYIFSIYYSQKKRVRRLLFKIYTCLQTFKYKVNKDFFLLNTQNEY